ncbi:MAG: FAD-dependent oxidoreductase [Bacillota bacterium]|nr:FAD-dependent oxidoreductase [Bacillota bacterium]
MSKKIVIIGNGAAGNAAAEEILNQNSSNDITIISNEESPVYYRPMLSEYVSEESLPKRFYLHDLNWYKENNIVLKTSSIVKQILPDAHELILDSGEELSYDALIICSGSNNFIPPMPGSTLKNVVSLRNLADAGKIKELASTSKKTVIIGGGLLGLELGWQLRKLDISVDVVEMMDRLLPRQLDLEASEIFENKVASTGIKVMKGVQTKGIVGEDSAKGVELSDGTIIDADFVIFSIGVRADTALAKEAGLKIERGIVVDDFMKTSHSDIYAAGDCAEHKGINYAIWPESVDQGKIAGLNSIGIRSVYEPVIPFNIYQGMNMRLFSIGDVGSDPGTTYDTHKVEDDNHFEKYFFVDDILVGGILLDDISKSSKLKKAMIARTSKTDFIESL